MGSAFDFEPLAILLLLVSLTFAETQAAAVLSKRLGGHQTPRPINGCPVDDLIADIILEIIALSDW
jgi:hypothetical protein